MRTAEGHTLIDHMALKVNQGFIIGLLVLAFLLDWTWLVAFVAAVMLVGTIWPGAGLFKLVYQRALKPAGLLKPDVREDSPQQHLFAQGVGGLMLLVAGIAFWAGAAVVGWLFTAIVVVLAAVNLFFGFCAGCFMYYQLGRFGVKPSLPTWQAATVKRNA